LSVVRMSPTRLMVSWRKSPEKNAARYYLYRGDDPQRMHPLKVLDKSGYFLETFIDEGLQPGRQYFYQVFPENWSGLRGVKSTTATATTPKE
jgi:hypothetical protein